MNSSLSYNPLIVALDAAFEESKKIVEELAPQVEIFKVGSRLFTEAGRDAIQWIHRHKRKVFLDLKFHDIPPTVKESARIACKMGVWAFTMHTCGGYDMMSETCKAVQEEAKISGGDRALVFGVTVLTSFSDDDLKSVGVADPAFSQVKRLAGLAKKAGLDGVVASGLEIGLIRETCGQNFRIVVPGVRPKETKNNEDQKRVISPKEALEAGATYLVVGRPILKEPNRVQATQKILQEIQGAVLQ